MKPEKRRLIHDLMDDAPHVRREVTLLAGGRVLRWRRRQRVAMQCLAVLAVLGITALCFERMRPVQPKTASAVATPTIHPAKASLTDEELLALFPKTPVALATLEKGKKRLIFLHRDDEERLLKRL